MPFGSTAVLGKRQTLTEQEQPFSVVPDDVFASNLIACLEPYILHVVRNVLPCAGAPRAGRPSQR